MCTWLDDGIHKYTTTQGGITIVSKRPWAAVIASGAGGTMYDGLVATATYTLIVRDCVFARNRYYGVQGDENSRLILDHCWSHHNLFVGAGCTYGATGDGTSFVMHRSLVENNGLGWQFCHGVYVQAYTTKGAIVQRSIIRDNTGWQLQAFHSSGTCKLDTIHTVLDGGRYTEIWHSSHSSNQTHDRVTMIHPYTSPPGMQSASGASIVYYANDLRLRAPNNARLHAISQVYQVGGICEDEATPGTWYRTALGGTTDNAARASDTTPSDWAAFTDMPVDTTKGFYWPDSSTTVGAYDVGPDLNDSLSLWPNGMYAQYLHHPDTPRYEWTNLPIFPEDTNYASTSCGEAYHLACVDLKITGVTGTAATDWNSTDYATCRLPASTDAANEWGLQHTDALAFNHLEQTIPGHTTGNSRITMAAATSGTGWKWTLTLEVDDTEISYEATVKTGHQGDSDSETFVAMTLVGGSGTDLPSSAVADFSSATVSFLTQRC
jgi:hypothetical protein